MLGLQEPFLFDEVLVYCQWIFEVVQDIQFRVEVRDKAVVIRLLSEIVVTDFEILALGFVHQIGSHYAIFMVRACEHFLWIHHLFVRAVHIEVAELIVLAWVIDCQQLLVLLGVEKLGHCLHVKNWRVLVIVVKFVHVGDQVASDVVEKDVAVHCSDSQSVSSGQTDEAFGHPSFFPKVAFVGLLLDPDILQS